MGDDNKHKIVARDVIEGHEVCQTRDARWLCFNNIYDHFQRPNFYDIGGTYLEESADFWFLYKTEQVSRLHLLHLLVCNRQEGSFSISLCDSNQLSVDDRSNIVRLNSTCTVYNVDDARESFHNHLTTYSFSELDVELMRNKKLLIAMHFNPVVAKVKQLPIDFFRSIHNFGQLLSDPVGADFVMESGDGTKFQVHKFLLAARSEVFKAMLRVDTAESINNVVRIVDTGKEDLSCVVEFLYTGTIKDMENANMLNLLMLADRYLLKGLKELAEHALALQLSTDNALESLMAADMYNAPRLKTESFKFIKANIESLESSIFQEIHNIQLVRDLCKYLALKY